MAIGKYLPSAQFTLITLSIVAAGGLVLAANYFTQPRAAGNITLDSGSVESDDAQWLDTLRTIQAQTGTALPPAADPNSVQTLLAGAQSDNMTDTLGKQLLINISNAKSQGLGGDTPTQDQIVATAAAQVNEDRGAPTYSASDLTVVPDSSSALHTYGNAVIAVMSAHPSASLHDTSLAMAEATDNNDSSKLSGLPGIGNAYAAIGKELAAITVPQTLVPLHLQVINNFARIAGTYSDMETVVTDPIRGLAGLQLYESLMNENSRVLTNIAQLLSKNAILFNTNEPGAAWSLFTATP